MTVICGRWIISSTAAGLSNPNKKDVQMKEANVFLTETLITRTDTLRKIKKSQYARQAIPLILLAVSIIVNMIYPVTVLRYLAIVAFAWYVILMMMFRTKHKIAKPAAGEFVSPLEGKVTSVRKSDKETFITIRKTFIDIVELRLPTNDPEIDSSGTWIFKTEKGTIQLRLKAAKLKLFDNPAETGEVIGIVPGSAVCTIYLPAAFEVLVVDRQNVFAGETALFKTAEVEAEAEAEAAAERPSILVEE